MLNRKLLILLLFGFIITAGRIHAGLWDYTLHIKTPTLDFNHARANAIKNYRQLALINVISKIISISDFKVVNKLIDNDSAYFFEDKLRLLNEKTQDHLYQVDITYYFNKNKILAFLKKNAIPYTLNLVNKVLFIPVYNGNIQGQSDWYQLFNNISNDDYLTHIFVVPTSDIDQTKILAKDQDYLLELERSYEVNDVIIAELNEQVLPQTTANDEASAYNSEPPITVYELNLTSLDTNTYKQFEYLSNMYEAMQYSIGFAEIVEKDKSLMAKAQTNSQLFRVTYNSFIDWVAIYNYLKQMPQIDEVFLSELNPNYSLIKVRYQGSMDDIISAAATRNIIIDLAEFTISCKGFCY